MALSNFERMIQLSEEVFSSRTDPDQLNVNEEVMEHLQLIHPFTISEYDDGNGPVCWILCIPTTLDLMNQFINQKILRAVYTNNQLQEVMTDFWFNHFNVSITKNQCALYIPAYERDVIRPNVFGSFQNILLATAKSPAMLLYLDNFSSSGTNQAFDGIINKRLVQQQTKKGKQSQGLNENYAREIMELHTMGVDGGYTQSDVTQAARVLTGWTIYPFTDYGAAAGMKKLLEKFILMAEKNYVELVNPEIKIESTFSAKELAFHKEKNRILKCQDFTLRIISLTRRVKDAKFNCIEFNLLEKPFDEV